MSLRLGSSSFSPAPVFSAQLISHGARIVPSGRVPDVFKARFAGEPAETRPVDYEARSQTFQVKTPSGGILRMRRWEPSADASPRRPQSGPPILMIHGASSRSAWMSPLAWILADKKPAVYGLDLTHLSYADDQTGRIPSYQDLIREVRETVQWLHARHGEPVFIVAHSMGALMTTVLAQDPPMDRSGNPLVKGMVLMAPAFKSSPESFSLKFHTKYLRRLALEKMGIQARPLTLPATQGLEALTVNPEKHRLLRETKDRIFRFTARSWHELHKMMRVNDKHAGKVTVATLMFVPQQDVIADPHAMKSVFKRLASTDKQMVVYDQARHDLVWEPVLDEMARVINRWLTARSVSFRDAV